MQWSRLKKMLENRFCDKLAPRLQIQTARYTNDEEVGRIWITLDKQQIFSAGDLPNQSRPDWFLENGCVFCNTTWARTEIEHLLLPSLSLPIEEALLSPDEIVRALAIFDRRIGTRRLRLLANEIENQPLLVRHFYAIRFEAETS